MLWKREKRYTRRSARVILVDPEDRVLLFRFPFNHKRSEDGHCWITPGGGVDKAEALHAAAVRELREETGFVAGEMPLVACSEGYVPYDWAKGIFRDDFFFWRTGDREIDDTGREEWERSQITAHHWWSVAELRATQERVIPLDLADLLEDLIAGRIPAEPVELPWHHPPVT